MPVVVVGVRLASVVWTRISAEIDALMRAYDGAVPGASVVVLRVGETEVRRSYGLADLSSASPQPRRPTTGWHR